MGARNTAPLILLVEDDALLRRALKRNLTAQGFVVTAVGCAADAVVAAGVDIAVLDVDLPEVDGVTLAVDLLRRFRVTRFVFFTASTDPTIRARARKLGPVIAKSDGVDALVAALRRLYMLLY